jgi:hypothetical protein
MLIGLVIIGSKEYYFKALRWADSLGMNASRQGPIITWDSARKVFFKDRTIYSCFENFEALKDTGAFLRLIILAGTYQFMAREDKNILTQLVLFRNLVFSQSH